MPLLPIDNIVDNLSDLEVIAHTAYGENRGGGIPGMQSVINVIFNRANKGGWWGNTAREVCLKPYQFSCWIPGSSDYIATINADDFQLNDALDLAQEAIEGNLIDITKNSCYYISESMKQLPHWCIGHTPAVTISGQIFFNDIT